MPFATIIGLDGLISAKRRFIAEKAFSYEVVGISVAIFDVITIIIGSVLAQYSYSELSDTENGGMLAAFGVGLMCSVIYLPIVRSFGGYSLPVLINPSHIIRQLVTSCIIVILSITAVLFMLKVGSSFSRIALMACGCLMLILGISERFASAAVIRRLVVNNRIVGRRAFFIGDPEEIDALDSSKLLRRFGLSDVGRFFLSDPDAKHCSIESEITNALVIARRHRSNEIVLALRNRPATQIREIERAMRQTPLAVKLLPNSIFRSIIDGRETSLSYTMHCLELQRAPLSRSEQASKRALDIIGATLGFALLVPVLLLVIIAIKLDSPGPAIFRQKRNGFDEVPFTIFKFRTMTVMEDGDRVVQAQQGDTRITRVGAFLRRTSVDELPQLLNVLRGEMSLVGPRPHAIVHDRAYRTIIDGYFRRHHVKPGMTGWAQVHGLRGETNNVRDMKRRVDFDLWYIHHWSVYLEIYILLRTVFALSGDNAF